MGFITVSVTLALLLMMTSRVEASTETMGNLTFECPEGWTIKAPDCFLITNTSVDFTSAKNTCEKYGAKLVILDDEKESLMVSQLVWQTISSIDVFWIGNIQLDGQSICGGMWDILQPADPTDSSPYVSSSAASGRWRTTDPATRLPFVCKFHACIQGTFRCMDGSQCVNDLWKCDGEYDCPDQSDEVDCAGSCGSYFRQPSGNLSTTYTANKACTWVIEGLVGQVLSITFTTVDLESDVDYIEVWSGGPTIATSSIKASLTGKLNNRVVYGDNNFLILRLFSDLSVQESGFEATWQPDDELSLENRIVEATDNWTELTSPHYNSQRPFFYFRQFTVYTTDGSHITMEILDNQLMDQDFTFDPQELSSVVFSNNTSVVYVSLGSSFVFQISSKSNVTRAFRARVRKGCYTDLTIPYGYLESPSSIPAGSYPASINCTYIIRAPPGQQRGFMFRFEAFTLADNKDSVRLTTLLPGNQRNSSLYTNSRKPSDLLYSGSEFSVEFVSSIAQSDGYFTINFTLDCLPLSNTNMILSTNVSHAYTSVNVSCPSGYTFAQEEFFNSTMLDLYCMEGGNWDKSQLPTCQRNFCNIPPSITDGFIVSGSGNVQVNATVTYQCYPGFSMKGSDTVTCQVDGLWTTPPECQTFLCPAPQTINNGNVTIANGNSSSSQHFGTVVNYTCDQGYDLVGSSYSLCQSSGNWSVSPPICQAIRCPLPSVDKATLSPQEAIVLGSSLNVTCNTGYTNNGSDRFQRTCTDSGIIDVPRNACQDINECNTSGACGAHQVCQNTEGSFACVCEKGYQQPPNMSTCEDIDECSKNMSDCDITNGSCTNTNGSFLCSCKSGYTLYAQNGTADRYIPFPEDGLQQGDVYYINRTCVPISCQRPLSNITHGKLLSTQTFFVYRNTAKYQCDLGYTINGSDVITCLESGNWSAPSPVCTPMYCARLVPTGIVSAVYPDKETQISDKVTLICRSEVGPTYNKTLYCAYNPFTGAMMLQGDSPNCPAIDCGDPRNITTGASSYVYNLNVSTLGASFEFSCMPGNILTGISTAGNRTVICGTNGRWGFGSLFCEEPRCTDPGTPGGMNMTSASFDINGQVEYMCLRPGYIAKPQRRTCVKETNQTRWNGSTPVCIDIAQPVFTDCPSGINYRALYDFAGFAMPSATDNSGLVHPLTVFPPGFRLDMPVTQSVNVTFTATDSTDNNASCTVQVEMNEPGVLPSFTCPDYLELNVTDKNYTIDLQAAGKVTGVNLTFTPSSMVLVAPSTVGSAPYLVTTTDRYGFQFQCAFMVEIRPTVCLEDYISPDGATKNCMSQPAGGLSCEVTCDTGKAFQDGKTSMTYSCTGQNIWSPVLPARSCTPISVPEYAFITSVTYTSNMTGQISSCVNQLQAQLTASIPTKSTPCNVYVDGVANIRFSANASSATITNSSQAVILVELRVANMSVSIFIDDLNYCRGILQRPGTKGSVDLFTVSANCANETSTVTFTPQSINVSSSGYICTPDSTAQSANSQNFFCVQCEPGYMSSGSQCVECPNGQYQNETGQTQCKPCPNGAAFSMSPRVSASQCIASCPPGFANGQGAVMAPSRCFACPPDTYLNTSYTANCTACPPTTSTYGKEGAISPAECKAACPAGQYLANNMSCVPCPRGFYKDTTGNTKCMECPANMTTANTGSNASTVCTTPSGPLACQNSGTLAVYFHQYACDCQKGYYGNTCGNWTDPCASSPCYNNGTCKALSLNNYTCTCPSGFSGNQCETDNINNCTNSTCSDPSFCRDKIDSADCVCPSDASYTQPKCQISSDICSPNPCKNGGVCQNFASVRFACICLPGYTGTTCETDIDECALNPWGCLYGGQCIQGINNYSCSCNNLYQGQHCEQIPDFCSPSPCPSGVCYSDYNVSVPVCVCSYPFHFNASSGQCDEIDICSEERPCKNNATCQRVSPGQYHCVCPQGYEGSLCQHNINDCKNNPCVHGQCQDGLNNYTCVCESGYLGAHCDTYNCSGTCITNNTQNYTQNYDGGVSQCSCICKLGITGARCEIDIDECASLPCKHNGTCTNSATPGEYTCTCRDGWTGKNCDMLTDYCNGSVCQNGGSCYSLQDTFFCRCEGGTYGNTCNQTTNLCDTVNPCASTGQCQSGNGTAMCNCSTNYTGTSCQLAKNFCSTNPCQTGQCVTGDQGYTCQCQEGTSTNSCMAISQSCASVTCPPGSDCVETGSGPVCLCPPGHIPGGGICKNTSSDFDIYFTKASSSMIRALQPFNVTDSITLSFWISYLRDTNSSTVQLISDSSDSMRRVLHISKTKVSFGDVYDRNFTYDYGTVQALSVDGKWNFFALTWERTGIFNIYVNSMMLPTSGTPNSSFPSLGSLLFFYIGDDFTGYMSQINVWNRILTTQEVLNVYQANVLPSGLVYRWSEYQFSTWAQVISPSKVKRGRKMCQRGFYDTQCANITDKKPPAVICSKTELTNATARLLQLADVISPHVIFPGGEPAMSNLNGTVLTFGAYSVVYAAKNAAGDVAICRFKIYVQDERRVCSPLEGKSGDSLLTPCDTRNMNENVTCSNNNSITPFTPKIVACGKLGFYNLEDQYSLPPAQLCSATGDLHIVANMTLRYKLSITCSDTDATLARNSLEKKVMTLASKWPSLCNNFNCDSVTLRAVCDEEDSSSPNVTVVLTFNNLPTRLTSNDNSITLTVTELLETAAKEDGSFNISSVANAALITDQVNVAVQQTCSQGYGRFGNVCIQCVAGSFLNLSTNMCEQCAVGTYTNISGQSQCVQCPQNLTTLRVGSTSCVVECREGQFYNLSDSMCHPCLKSFYQPSRGKVTCFPCPPNFFTEDLGKTSANDCHEACPAGTEQQGTICVPCPRGTYRTGLVYDDRCQSCPEGNTTATNGSTSEKDCSQTACPPGQMRNASTNKCVPCDYGYYQPSQWQDMCLPCGTNYTTNTTGSINATDCIFVCPPGYEDAGSHQCRPCQKGSYRSNSLQDRFLMCTTCNISFTTDGSGSTSSSDCNITACSPGQMRNASTNQCVPCDYGYYQPSQWQDMCLPCGTNYTTNTTGSINATDCIFVCPPGYEDPGNHMCQPCQKGFYRSSTLQDRFLNCSACNTSFTTASTGSTTSRDCSITACTPGHMHNMSTNQCMPCDYGYYQPNKWQDVCLPCNVGYTTNMTGSTSASDCLFVCPPGFEDPGNHTCQPCQKGFYRSSSLQDRFIKCTACNNSFTTADNTSVSSSDCNIRVCTAGSYRNTSDNMCYPCPIGWYQPTDLQTSCILCSGNLTTRQPGAINSTQCEFYCSAGYEVSGVNACLPCARGKYRNSSDADKFLPCHVCQNGTTTDGTGAQSASFCNITLCTAGQQIVNGSCVSCPQDYYQNETLLYSYTKCTQCPQGRGTNQTGQMSEAACLPVCGAGEQYSTDIRSCVACPQGTWNSGNSSQRFDPCANCPDTFVTVGQGATSVDNCTLKDCPPGEFIQANISCIPCPMGTYQDERRQYSCKSCPLQTNTSGSGTTDVRNCTVYCHLGEEQKSLLENCSLCNADYYKSFGGYGLCRQCTGNFTSDSSRTICNVLYCDYGFQMNAAGNSCYPCSVGFYKELRGNSSCIKCPLNTTTAGLAATNISDCNRAFCEPGLYSINSMLPCLPCPLGAYKNETGSQNCTQCPANLTTSGIGSITANSCSLVVCPAGQYRNSSNMCQDCDTGYFQSQPGQTDCSPCAANYTTDGKASTSLENCKVVCPPGQYRLNRTTCQKCEKGEYQPSTGATSCVKCDANFTTNSTGAMDSLECFIVCNPGYYQANRTTCQICPVGSYQSSPGTTSCVKCDPNFTTNITGSVNPTDCYITCPPGQRRADRTTCQPCEKDYYQPNAGATSCTACGANFTTNGTGSVNSADCYIVCDPGYYQANRTTCQICPVGSYQSSPGTTSCVKCDPNFTTNITGSVNPTDCYINCSSGQYRSSRTSCQMCDVGSFQPNYGAQSCLNCSMNLTTAGNGSTSPSDCYIVCPPGSYRYNNTQCTKCPLSKYQNESGARECTACPAGYFTQQEGSTQETDCLPICQLGQYLNISGRACYLCPVGTYNQDARNKTMCTSCPEGYITSGPGAQSINACNITDCTPGQYRVQGGCKDCPKGTYQPQESQDICIACPPGNTTFLTGRAENSSCVDDCGDGTSYDMVTKKCENCVIGYYRKKNETVGCVKCPAGKTTITQAASSCVAIVTEGTTTVSSVEKKFVVRVTIRVWIGDCINAKQMSDVIKQYVLNRLMSADSLFPALCASNCQSSLSIRFIGGGCLSSGRRKKRSQDPNQDVLVELADVSEELAGTDYNGNHVTEKSQSVVTRAFYDTQQDASLLDSNGVQFVEVISSAIIQQCQPGQKADQAGSCVNCPVGFHSPNGVDCVPCEKDTYQDEPGMASCKNCTAKTYTNGTAAVSSSNCTKHCDEPDSSQRYCSGHGTCQYDIIADNGVKCECLQYYINNDCSTKEGPDDQQIQMVAGIIGGLAGLLVLILVIFGIVLCMRRATRRKKKMPLQEDTCSDSLQAYNLPLGERPDLRGRPAVMYLNPGATDDDAREFYHAEPSLQGSRKRSQSYEGRWRDFPEMKTNL